MILAVFHPQSCSFKARLLSVMTFSRMPWISNSVLKVWILWCILLRCISFCLKKSFLIDTHYNPTFFFLWLHIKLFSFRQTSRNTRPWPCCLNLPCGWIPWDTNIDLNKCLLFHQPCALGQWGFPGALCSLADWLTTNQRLVCTRRSVFSTHWEQQQRPGGHLGGSLPGECPSFIW